MMLGHEIKICIFFLSAFLCQTDSARILCVFTWPGTSHMITFSALTHALAEKGHELVVVSTSPSKNPPGNYTDINTWESLKGFYSGILHSTDIYDFEDIPKIMHPLFYWTEATRAVELTFSNPDVKKLLGDEKGFDLVIAEDFVSDAIFGFAPYFKAPLILISSLGGYHWANYAVGNPYNPAYSVNNLLEYSDKKTFYERLVNSLVTWYWDLGSHLYYYGRQDAIMEEFFGPGLPSTSELRYSASLVLVNNHFTLNYPKPLVPAFVEVGGMHVKPPTGEISAEMKKWLDEAEHGAIYFSLGSNLRGELMPEEKRSALLAAFGELKQRIIWKWDLDTLQGKPDNVMITKWAPQMDILSHPNVKLFMTHGGLLGAQEAMHNGVPIVGIPIFGDQRLNVQRAVNEGYGVMLSIKNITRASVLEAIDSGLNDQSIRAEVKRRQRVYLDQPESPLERAVFWTEYIIRHEGAPHMRSAALDLTWYQLHLLDVYVFLVLIVIGVLFILCIIFKCIYSVFINDKSSTLNKKSK